MVFLLNMFPEEQNKSPGMGHKVGRCRGISGCHCTDRLRHAANIPAAHLVFLEHDAGRTLFAGESLALEQREQAILFLAVMTTIGKVAKEITRLVCRLKVELPTGVAALSHGL